MQPMNANPDMSTDATVPKAAPARAKPQGVQFPFQSHCAIDEAMKASIERLARRWRWKEAQVHRTALIFYLSANDPVFARDNSNA
jgi:hypothetical protein